MTTCRSLLALALLGLLAVWAPPAARAEEPAPSAAAFVRQGVGRLLDALYDEAGRPRGQMNPEQLKSEVDRVLDYQLLLRRALGRHWQGLSEADRKEIADLTALRLIAGSVERFRQSRRPQLAYLPERDLGAGRFEVPTTVQLENGTPVSIVYRVLREGQAWRVYDIIAEGVSLVSNYREQFDALFQKGGAAAVLKALREPTTATR